MCVLLVTKQATCVHGSNEWKNIVLMLRQFEIYVLLCFPFVNLLLRGDDNVFFFVFVFVFRLLLRTLLLSFSWLPFSCKAIDNASTKWLFSASLAIPKYPPSSSWSSLSEEPAMYSSKYSLHSTRNNGNKRIKAARVKMRGHSMLHGSGGWYWFWLSVFSRVCVLLCGQKSIHCVQKRLVHNRGPR